MYIRILDTDDWVVEYDAENNRYRVSYFQGNHFVDEVLFDEVDRSKSVKNKKCEHEWACFKRVKDFHICSECMALIKELRAKQKGAVE